MADQVSDSILDAILCQDINARCAIETLFTSGICVIAGEINTHAKINVKNIVINGVTINAPSGLSTINAANIQTWLNGLAKGVFSIT